jgi:hypothetical protein
MKPDTMPVLHRALILPQCILNVPYFEKDVKGGDFPALPLQQNLKPLELAIP